jgi:hypothetical protein
MGDFKVIETQEEFDKAIKSRLAQKDRELEEKYKDYLSPDKVKELKAEQEKRLKEFEEKLKEANEKIASNDDVVSKLTNRATEAEGKLLKQKVAHTNKLPLELADRLIGTTEEELSKDAENLASLIKPSNTPPLRTTEGAKTPTNNIDAQFMGLLAQVNEQLQNQ